VAYRLEVDTLALVAALRRIDASNLTHSEPASDPTLASNFREAVDFLLSKVTHGLHLLSIYGYSLAWGSDIQPPENYDKTDIVKIFFRFFFRPFS
jgi:hypothetical protein